MRRPVIALLLLGACRAEAPPGEPPRASGCSERGFEGSRFTLCDPGRGTLRLIAVAKGQPPLRSFADVATSVDPAKVAFAMNAGMFDEDGRPIGLTVVDGRLLHAVNLRDGGGNFHLKPNGVLLVSRRGKAEIVVSSALPAAKVAGLALATQSGPMLVVDGKIHPRFEVDGQSRFIRNAVGVTSDGQPLFVISEDAVSFGKLARFFRDVLQTPNALYLDGSVSSLWDPANGRQDSHSPLGPILIAFMPAASMPGREGRAKP